MVQSMFPVEASGPSVSKPQGRGRRPSVGHVQSTQGRPKPSATTDPSRHPNESLYHRVLQLTDHHRDLHHLPLAACDCLSKGDRDALSYRSFEMKLQNFAYRLSLSF